MSINRLPSGGRIDRRKPVTFTFDGRTCHGYAGDTLTSALLANGVHFVGRSFKYHRPRGILAAGAEEPNALFAIGDGAHLDTNARGTAIEIYDGLAARSINAWPSLKHDLASLNSVFHRFLPGGFYYKTFMWPRWTLFEGLVRRTAGLGKAPRLPDAERYDHRHIHVDVLVVGGGAAGLMAARAAAAGGARVLIAEQDSAFGGALLWNGDRIDGMDGGDWATQVANDLRAREDVTVLPRTTVTGYFDHNYLTAVERVADHLAPEQRSPQQPRQRFWHIRAREVVLATGAIERPAVFPGNDRPGILLASAVRHYLNRYAVTPGQRVAVVTNNDSAYLTALDLAAAGVSVAAIVDSRANPDGAVVERARSAGLRILANSGISGTAGGHRVKSVRVIALSGGAEEVIACDAVAMSGGWNPAVHLFSQSGGKLRFDEAVSGFVPGTARQRQQSVGAVSGVFTTSRCLCDGLAAGREALRRAGLAPADSFASPAVEAVDSDPATVPFWRMPAALVGHDKQWIDFHNDVTASDVALAARENFVSVEHLKRYTTLGMAADQGKTSNVNGLAIMGEITNRSIPEVGTTTFRPPYTPLTFGAIAGRSKGAFFMPQQQLPTVAQQRALGAVMEDYGSWSRPAFYPRAGEDEAAAVRREVLAVRNAVGILDYSPLGKIEVTGPDALDFLNHMVLTNLATLKTGRGRYNLMLNEAGIIIDDGVITRLADNHYLVGTTSGGAGRIALMLEEWLQCEWPHLKVHVTNVTTAWGVIMISGPQARELLRRTGIDIDLSPAAFPHMTMQEGMIGGVRARVHRVSFTGEVSYEVAVPTGYVSALWDLFMDEGRDLGLTPIGIESLMVLRTEKGYLHVGSDTDGTTVPDDVGYGEIARKKTMDFVGKRSLSRPEAMRPDRPQLVGLESLDGRTVLPVGGHCLSASVTTVPAMTEGHVTSSCWSPTLGRPIAMGLLVRGRARMGEIIQIYVQGQWLKARVVEPRFHDIEGSRLNA